jgi:hypothetical protein
MQGLVEQIFRSSPMSRTDFFESLASLEQNEDLHCARLLVLLDAFAEADGQGEVEGITKLAKLDFLLRYPAMLERALKGRQHSPRAAEVESFERNSVESRMVRYRFGPWDHRYGRFLAILQAKGLVRLRRIGQTRHIGLTGNGRQVARRLGADPLFAKLAGRAILLRKEFNLTATNLMKFVYATFPELSSMQLNEPIK